jgi:hypothetical protein
MERFIDNLLEYCAPIIWTFFVVMTFIVKSILKRYDYNVIYWFASISDYRNLKKLKEIQPQLQPIYYGLIISTLCAIIFFLLFVFSTIIY